MQFANCAALAAILCIVLTANICSEIDNNLRLCSFAEADFVLKF